MKKFEFDGVSGTVSQELTYEETFYDGMEWIFDDQEVRTHHDDDFQFDYYYTVQVTDLCELTGDDNMENKFSVDLHMVVVPGSMDVNRVTGILETYGLNSADEITSGDQVGYGSTIPVLTETIEGKEGIHSAVEAAFSAMEAVDGLRGFYLDRPWNMVGTNGWDTIRYFLGEQDRLFNF